MGANNPTYHTIVGTNAVVELPPKRTWNLTDGFQTYRQFAGPTDLIRAKFSELAATSDSGVDELQEDINGKAGKLVARVLDDSGGSAGGNTEELNAVWEVIAQDVYKPIEAHSQFKNITAQHKREIEKTARDGDPIPAVDKKGVAWTPTEAETILYSYYSAQVLDYILTQFIIRKSTVVSQRSEITASYASTNRVVTLASIGVPSVLIGSLSSLPKDDGSSGGWEWLKKAPQVRQVTKRKFQIVYEWWGAEQWSKIIYGGTWEPLYE